ncbi:MAG: hypothetical protein NVS3B10_02900 [Polyangiales bacterium]
MVRSPSLACAGIAGCLAAVAVVACGGKIAPSPDDNLESRSAGPYAATGTSDVATPAHPPASTPVAVPSAATGDSHRDTWVNGPIGFVVQDAFSFDTGPTSNRELRGVWITSFTPACDKRQAIQGSGVLRIDFSEQAGTVPPGTYPLEGPATPDAKTAYAQVWWVTAAGCGTTGTPGAHFESGTVTITKSDATGMVGSFQGILVDFDGNASPVDGHFDAPRCPTGGGACSP